MESRRSRAERFLENRVEPAWNALEREGREICVVKKYLIKSLVQHYKFGCYMYNKKEINKYFQLKLKTIA